MQPNPAPLMNFIVVIIVIIIIVGTKRVIRIASDDDAENPHVKRIYSDEANFKVNRQTNSCE